MTGTTQPLLLPRYKIGYYSDEQGMRSSTPTGIPDPEGTWVRFEHAQTLIAHAQRRHEAELAAIGAGGVSGPLLGQPQAMPDLSHLTERGAKAWAGVDAQALRDGTQAPPVRGTLRAAAQAVVDRWDTPLWKDVPTTAEYIGRLRAALAAQVPQPGYVLVPVEPTTDQEWAGKQAALRGSTMAEACKIYKAMLAAAPKAPQQAAPAVGDDLRDRLVAISAAIADQDDRGAQAMLREILAAPQQEEQEVQKPVTLYPGCSRWGFKSDTAQPAPSGDAESLLRDARGAIWQPSNPEICKRIDDFLDAVRKEGDKP